MARYALPWFPWYGWFWRSGVYEAQAALGLGSRRLRRLWIRMPRYATGPRTRGPFRAGLWAPGAGPEAASGRLVLPTGALRPYLEV